MNAQRIVESLVAGGLCEARRDPNDARRRPLHPTSRGRKIARSVEEWAQRSEQRLADAVGAETYRSLVAALQALADCDARDARDARDAGGS